MKILSVTAQKADSTGSGIYLTELVNSFNRAGHTQAVLCGVASGETPHFPQEVAVFPVAYESETLPFPICGMSDEMPYPSTRYKDLTDTMSAQLFAAFSAQIKNAVETFQPDVIYCHHLYFLAGLIRDLYPQIPLYGQCHGSDLRQLRKNPWKREWILSQIPKLDGIFALHEDQKQQISDLYQIPASQITVTGTGYNSNVFYKKELSCKDISRRETDATLPNSSPAKCRLIFAGKLSEKKGIFSLLRALHLLENPQQFELVLAGGYGNEEEYNAICDLAKSSPFLVTLPGRLNQKQLAAEMNASDVFVLPSFYEGLPLVLAEAMACGLRIICTDLPGIRPWMDRPIPGNGILFVEPPRMQNADEPVAEHLPAFEKRLAEAIIEVQKKPLADQTLVRKISWDALGEKLCSLWAKNIS